MMKTFKKKPILVKAWQWTGKINDIPKEQLENGKILIAATMSINNIKVYIAAVDNVDRQVLVNIGDWVIEGVNGVLYPCPDSSFKTLYDPL